MTYKLKFLPHALKSFKKLDNSIQKNFKTVLHKRLEQPKVEKHRLYGDKKGYYKIKLRSQGYRLIYRVLDQEVTVLVVEVDRRDKVYLSK